jgi:hypothetical protein
MRPEGVGAHVRLRLARVHRDMIDLDQIAEALWQAETVVRLPEMGVILASATATVTVTPVVQAKATATATATAVTKP